MKRMIAAIAFFAALAPTGASAEFREVRQSIFGMD